MTPKIAPNTAAIASARYGESSGTAVPAVSTLVT